MKHLSIAIIAGTALMLGSCTTIRKTATSVNVTNSVTQYPTVADLEIKPKAEAQTAWLSLFQTRAKLERKRGNLIAETLKQHDADILLEPQFIVRKNGPFNREIIVSGYPARYTNFRKASAADIEALKVAGAGAKNDKTVYNANKGILGVLFK